MDCKTGTSNVRGDSRVLSHKSVERLLRFGSEKCQFCLAHWWSVDVLPPFANRPKLQMKNRTYNVNGYDEYVKT